MFWYLIYYMCVLISLPYPKHSIRLFPKGPARLVAEVSGNGSGSYTWWYVPSLSFGWVFLIYGIRSPFLRFLNYGHLWYPRISQDGLQPRKMYKQIVSRLASARRSFASGARKETHAFACRVENKMIISHIETCCYGTCNPSIHSKHGSYLSW